MPSLNGCLFTPHGVNSLAPGKFELNFRYVIFKWNLAIDGWGIFCEIAPIWMLLDFTDDQSTSVHVMAWFRQATSHYLSQCSPRSMSPSGITRPQWVKIVHKAWLDSWFSIPLMSIQKCHGKKYDKWISLKIPKQSTTMGTLVPSKAFRNCNFSGNLQEWLMVCKRKPFQHKSLK